MGLENFVSELDNEGSDSGKTTKEAAQFDRIQKEKFEDALDWIGDEFDVEWSLVDNHSSGTNSAKNFSYEYVYEIPLDEPNLCIRIFSSIDSTTDRARDKGSDAIRTVIWDKRFDTVIGGARRTNRIKTWRKNLNKKIEHLLESWNKEVKQCEVCGDGWMIEKEGEYGKFLGCTNYSRDGCHNTKNL